VSEVIKRSLWRALSTILTPDNIISAGSAKGGLISKEDVVLALKKGTAVAGSAAKHSTAVVAAVGHSPAPTLAAHGMYDFILT
jgi:hypothetical protein